MNTQLNVEQLMQQTRRYEYDDGLRDVQLAVMFLSAGAMVWLAFNEAWLEYWIGLAATFGRWVMFASMALVFLPALLTWGALGLMNIVRRRWLWRKSGIVKAARWHVSRRVTVVAAVILLAGLGAAYGLIRLGIAKGDLLLRMLWSATGWSFGYTLVGVGREIGIPRYVRVGVLGGLASTLLLILPLSFGQGTLALSVLWSLLLTISGAVTLRRAVLTMQEDDRGE
jgi:hypothetical protein